MKLSLKTKLSLSYIFLALLLVAALSLSANMLLEKQFTNYIIKQQKMKDKDVVGLISQQYNDKYNTWNISVIENIGMNALEQGLIVKVKDAKGNIVWDATMHNNGLCMQMLNHMSNNMISRYPNFKGGYVENSYPIMHNFSNIGSIDIGYFGPFFLDDNDLAFINTLNKMLIGVGIFSLFFAIAIATFMAKKLSNPISRVITAAKQISYGYFKDRINEQTDTLEIDQLISTINNLADTLERQESLRKRLTADVAHELRTPLTTLQSHMEAMIDGIWEIDADRLKSCHDEILRISRLVGDLEKLAKFEGENLILNKTQFDISKLIQQIVKNFEADFLNKRININFYGEQEIISADQDKISQVIVNLLSNALKYTPSGGITNIYVKGLKNGVEIRVKDTGIGIPKEDLPYIFERFYRADKSRNRLTGGSGIGLAIVKAIVEAHHGNISVQSELNKGTEFIVTLPK